MPVRCGAGNSSLLVNPVRPNHERDQDVAVEKEQRSEITFDFSDTDVGKEAAAKATTATKTHTVEKGENLSVIAEQELGSQSRWKEIYELNKELIGKDPDLIHPGQVLKVPEL